MQDLIRDLKHTLRRLARTPVFTIATLVTLALGIGANTAIFSVIHSVLLKPLPFPEPDRLVRLREASRKLSHECAAVRQLRQRVVVGEVAHLLEPARHRQCARRLVGKDPQGLQPLLARS